MYSIRLYLNYEQPNIYCITIIAVYYPYLFNILVTTILL